MDTLSGRRILVTGAGGFLGRHVVKNLHDMGADPIAVDLPISRLDKLANLDRVKIRVCDLTHLSDIARLMARERPDVVAHLASILNCPDEDLNFEINYEGTKNLAESMIMAGVRRIVFVSSMTATFKHLNAYGRSKKFAEEFIREKGLDWTIVRPNLMYGRSGTTFEKLVGFIRMIPGIVPVIGNGKVMKQPIHVEDMAEFLSRVIASNTSGEVFQVGGPDRVTFDDYLDAVMRALNVHKWKIHAPYGLCFAGAKVLAAVLKNPPVTPDNVYELNQPVDVESASLERRFGFKMRSLREGLEETFRG